MTIQAIEFQAFPKIPRLSRDCIITEKLDGTNASIIITEDGQVGAASRNRLITPEDDNFGFARWVQDNRDDLLELGPGRFFGEWWGNGIQRGYGLNEKRFSLFHTGGITGNLPECVGVVPTLLTCEFNTLVISSVLDSLKQWGSIAAPGFMNPEGIVIYHTASRQLFKKLIENDHQPKGVH